MAAPRPGVSLTVLVFLAVGLSSTTAATKGSRFHRKFCAAISTGGAASMDRAVQIWRKHADQIDLPLLGEGALPVFAQLYSLTRSQDTSVRQNSWDLLTEMLPGLHASGADLDGLWFEWQNGHGQGMPVTIMIAATMAAQHTAQHFLATNGFCLGVRNKDGSPSWAQDGGEASPASQLLISWLFGLMRFLESHLFSAELDGRWETFADPAVVPELDQLFAGMPRSAWHDIVRALDADRAKFAIQDSSGRLHTVRHVQLFKVIEEKLTVLIETLLKCYNTQLLNLADSFGNAPIHYATRPGGQGVLKTLVQAGADTGAQNQYGQTPLHLAHIHRLRGLAEFLVSTGSAAVEEKDKYGLTAGQIEEAQARRTTNRLEDDAAFRRNVDLWYEKFDSSRNATGGWSNTTLPWPTNNACDFDELDPSTLTDREFGKMFISMKKPAVIRGGAAGLHARAVFTKSALRKRLGKVKVMSANIPYKSRYTAESESKLSVKSMLKSMRAENSKFAKELLSQGARVPEYVFNVINPEKSSPIQKSMSKIINAAKVPEVLPWVTDSDRTAEFQFYLGGMGTGAPFHHHRAAWNALMYGKKYWVLVPHSQAIFSVKPALNFLKEEYTGLVENITTLGLEAPYHCVQNAGDVIVLPSGWSHLTLNLQASVGVAKEFNPHNLLIR